MAARARRNLETQSEGHGEDEDARLLKSLGASPREIDIFLARRPGLKLLAAAELAGMSVGTAKTHLALHLRLNVHSFVELLDRLRRHGRRRR